MAKDRKWNERQFAPFFSGPCYKFLHDSAMFRVILEFCSLCRALAFVFLQLRSVSRLIWKMAKKKNSFKQRIDPIFIFPLRLENYNVSLSINTFCWQTKSKTYAFKARTICSALNQGIILLKAFYTMKIQSHIYHISLSSENLLFLLNRWLNASSLSYELHAFSKLVLAIYASKKEQWNCEMCNMIWCAHFRLALRAINHKFMNKFVSLAAFWMLNYDHEFSKHLSFNLLRQMCKQFAHRNSSIHHKKRRAKCFLPPEKIPLANEQIVKCGWRSEPINRNLRYFEQTSRFENYIYVALSNITKLTHVIARSKRAI
jgi:hypothetical protein